MGDTIKPRLEEAGADCDRVAFIDDADMGLTFIDDRLEKTIRSFQAKLLVLDPLQAFMPSNADMQNASHVRSIMRKLGKVAEKHKLCGGDDRTYDKIFWRKKTVPGIRKHRYSSNLQKCSYDLKR